MNDALKEAMAIALPDRVPDPRDHQFHSGREEAAVQPDPTGAIDAAAVKKDTSLEQKEKERLKQEKVDALRPLA